MNSVNLKNFHISIIFSRMKASMNLLLVALICSSLLVSVSNAAQTNINSKSLRNQTTGVNKMGRMLAVSFKQQLALKQLVCRNEPNEHAKKACEDKIKRELKVKELHNNFSSITPNHGTEEAVKREKSRKKNH